MNLIEIFKSIILGIVEGITEWLPISSTGHMILVDQFLKLNMSEAFMEMFLVVIQLGAIMAVVVLYWKKLFPFSFGEKEIIQKDTFIMWFKIIVSCIPAAIVGVLFDDEVDALFYNPPTIAIMLILVGIIFIIVENRNKNKKATINSIADITFKTAAIIGVFQLIAAVFPGTSRSGATIIGAMMIGVSRGIATEFTFFLAVPVMFGASLLKVVKFGFAFTQYETIILIAGLVSAFIVSIVSIKFLTGYIRKHDFKPFGWYRIVLGCVVLLFFLGKSMIG
jgi:undecaprenyl-diphosphatase